VHRHAHSHAHQSGHQSAHPLSLLSKALLTPHLPITPPLPPTHPPGDSGIIRTLESPLYVVRASNGQVTALDRDGRVRVLAVEPAEYGFKLALAQVRGGACVLWWWQCVCVSVSVCCGVAVCVCVGWGLWGCGVCLLLRGGWVTAGAVDLCWLRGGGRCHSNGNFLEDAILLVITPSAPAGPQPTSNLTNTNPKPTTCTTEPL